MSEQQQPPLLRVRDWDNLYENNRSRDMKRTNWFPAPNDLSADWYAELVAHDDGAAHLGVWFAVLMLASRSVPRGTLARGDGQPHTAETLARVTRLAPTMVQATVERLLKIGLLETGKKKSRKKSELLPHPGAGIPQDTARKPQEGAVEGKGREHHQQERNKKEKKGTEPQRTEPEGTESAHEVARAIRASKSNGVPKNPSSKADDDEKPKLESYASPADELKAIFLQKTHEPITLELLTTIESNLELNGVSMSDFLNQVRKHNGKFQNYPGFVRDLARTFRRKTRTAAPAVTAAEAYKCAICGSVTPGEGLRLVDGRTVPCTCATPEYVEHARQRGALNEVA